VIHASDSQPEPLTNSSQRKRVESRFRVLRAGTPSNLKSQATKQGTGWRDVRSCRAAHHVPSPDGIKPVDICTSASDPGCTFAALTHTAPPYDPPGDFTRYGFRVPVVIISPFTKSGYVSHVTTDSTAWLKFVEQRFGLKPLNARDGWSSTSDMNDLFDYKNPPWTTPPANPPSDSAGDCYDRLPSEYLKD